MKKQSAPRARIERTLSAHAWISHAYSLYSDALVDPYQLGSDLQPRPLAHIKIDHDSMESQVLAGFDLACVSRCSGYVPPEVNFRCY